jgi:hypothetical protein
MQDKNDLIIFYCKEETTWLKIFIHFVAEFVYRADCV